MPTSLLAVRHGEAPQKRDGSDYEDFCGPAHGLRRELRIGELRIFPSEVGFDHPTGGRALPSDEDWYLKLDDFGQRIFKRRPADRRDTVLDWGAHENSRVARKLDTNFVAGIFQGRYPNKREVRASWILGAAQAYQQELLTCRTLGFGG